MVTPNCFSVQCISVVVKWADHALGAFKLHPKPWIDWFDWLIFVSMSCFHSPRICFRRHELDLITSVEVKQVNIVNCGIYYFEKKCRKITATGM